MATSGPFTGKLFVPGDGAGRVVPVRVEADGTLVAGEGEDALRIPVREATLSFAGDGDSKLTVVWGSGPDRRTLYAERGELLPALRGLGIASIRETLDGLETRRLGRQLGGWTLVAAAALACVLGLWVSNRVLDFLVERSLGVIPRSWEVKAGAALGQAFSASGTPVKDPRVVEPIRTMLARLVEAAGPEAEGYVFEVEVLRDDTVNAFALPGGQIRVLTGLIEKAEDPGEVAGVLAHEVQHVLLRHSLLRIFQHLKWRLLVSMLLGDLETMSEVVLAKATGLLELSYDREAEREADRRGLDLLYRARIDPRGLPVFFGRLAEIEGDLAAKLALLSTHPGGKERVAYLEREIASRKAPAWLTFDLDWSTVRAAAKEAQ